MNLVLDRKEFRGKVDYLVEQWKPFAHLMSLEDLDIMRQGVFANKWHRYYISDDDIGHMEAVDYFCKQAQPLWDGIMNKERCE